VALPASTKKSKKNCNHGHEITTSCAQKISTNLMYWQAKESENPKVEIGIIIGGISN
jgi:hypothetical protein